MGLKDFFKPRKRKEEVIEKKELEIPPAPPTKEELPDFPSLKEAPKVEKPKEKEGPDFLEKIEDTTVKKQKEELEEREDLTLKKPIFVYLDAYQEMINEIGMMQSTLKESADGLMRVSDFKEDEDKEFNKWESQIKDIQRKLIFADKTLFGAQK